jgi:hypothetical protein
LDELGKWLTPLDLAALAATLRGRDCQCLAKCHGEWGEDGSEMRAPVPAHAPSRPHFKGDFKNPVKSLFLLFVARQHCFPPQRPAALS